MEKIKLNRREVQNLLAGIQGAHAAGVKGSHQFTYALGRTRRAIDAEVESINEALARFDEERVELCKAHADRDGEEPRIDGETRQFVITERKTEFAAAMKALREKIEVFLGEDVEVDVYRVLGEVPELASGIADGLLPILPEPKAG